MRLFDLIGKKDFTEACLILTGKSYLKCYLSDDQKTCQIILSFG